MSDVLENQGLKFPDFKIPIKSISKGGLFCLNYSQNSNCEAKSMPVSLR